MGQFDDLVPEGTGTESSGSPNQFDDLVPKRDRSFLGASLKSGLQSVPAAVGRVVEAVNPFTTSPEEIAILEKDPKKREELMAKTQAATALGRGRQAMEAAASQTMREVRPEDQAIQEKEYATLDPEKAAYLSPTRVAGDVLRNLPNIAVMAAGGVAARGAAASASAEALAAGATAEAARAAGAAAAARTMGGISAVGEGSLGYAQQAAQVQEEVLQKSDAEFLKDPNYLALLEKGYQPDAAKQIIAARAAQAAGLAGGLADMALGKAGGEILGRVVGEGGRLFARTGKAAAAEAGQEALQSAGEQVGANIATQNLGTGLFDDLAESVVSGAVVGGVTGGGFGAIAAKPLDTAKALKERQDVLNATALTEEVKAETGLTPSQNAALNANQRQLAPKLSPVQDAIRAQAISKGFDPDTALIISSIETGGTFNPTLKNKNSTAHGLFQMLDGTWAQYGGGDRNNVDLQIANGLNNLVATGSLLEADLNRAPTAVEMYLGQLLGARGASTVLQSADSMSILDAVKKYDPTNAEAIVNNNGMAGMTVAQAKAKWEELIEKHRLKLGLNGAATGITQAGTDIDGVLGEIDALLAETDSQALSKQEEADQARERSLLETKEGMDDLNEGVINAALEAQDAGLVGVVRPAEVQPTLPQDLRGAAPTYYSGVQGYNIQFDSDLDKAAYIVANNQARSKRDADYIKFLTNATGMTEEEARAYGKEVRVNIRNQLRAAGRTQDGSMLTVRIAPTDGGKFNEGFVSNDEFGSRQKYPNPNDGTPFTQTPILAAPDEAAVGQTLKEVKPAPGQVFAISHESNVAPPEYVRAVQQTLQTWVNRFSPTMRLIASFRTDRQPGQTGAQVETAWFIPRKSLGRGLYQINARPLYNHGLTEDGSRNSTTQAKAAYSLAHEFGHALVEHEFLKDLSPDQQNIINTLGTWEYFGEDFLSTLPPEKAAVLREYNTLKQAAETDSMTGVEWATRWLSPWKLSHGTGSKKGVESFLNKFLGEGSSKMSARQLAETMQARGDMLSVHEYMAEQMSRYAQSSNAFKGTPLEGNQFFARTFELLKEFFRALKATKAVAPGTAFKDWVDSLTRAHQETQGEASQPAPEAAVRKSAGKPRIRRRAVAVLPPSILPPPTETQATVEALEPSEGQKLARQMLHGQLRYLKEEDPHLWTDMAELVRTGQLEAFKSEVALQVNPELLDQMRWDTGEPADVPWKNTLDEVAKVLPKKAAYSWVSDGFRKMADMKYYAMTMRQAAYANPEVAGLQLINNTLTAYKSLKAWLEVDATKVSQAWAKLGKEQRGLMERAMRAEFESGENWFSLQNVNGKIRFVPTDKVREYASKNKLDEATVGVWMNSKNTYLQHMNTLHNVLRRRLEKRLAESPATLRARMKELAEAFAEIRNRPFIPQTRFGQYAIRVEEESGQVLHLEYFESPQQRDAAVTALKGKVGPGRKVVAHNYSMSSSILRTIPPQLLSTYASEMELTREQKKELREMLDLQTSNPQIRRYSSQLAQITGAGKDLLRSYADFMWHDSTNVAKMHAREEFNRGLRMINEDRMLYEDDFVKHDELSKLYNFADSYVKHILNPADEYSMVRSFVVVKQLWGNIKTAIANVNSLAQLWAVASTRQGLVQGTKTVGKTAGGQVMELVDRLSNLVTRGPAEAYRRLPPEERKAMAQAQERGILDETFAAQLASFANVGTLERLNSTGNKWTKRVLWAGMQPQHLVENYTRRVTFLASFRGYRAEGQSFEQAFEAAQRDTLLLQGDNSLQNRPPFMRGKAALFTIYYGYMQNMLYLMSGGYERARRRRADIGIEKASGRFNSETAKMWMAYAFMGGLMGLPGAEDLDNILSLVADKMFGKRFNLKEYAFELANAVSEGASEFGLDINPRSIVHGNLADATAFGLLPGVDLSASMSLGNAIPGASGLGELGQKGGGYKFLIAAMGPMGREVDSMIRLFDDDPSLLKKFNLIAPAGVKNLATAWNESEAGALYPSGGKVTRDLATGEIRDMTTGEVLARAMGFSPSIQTANRELHYMQKDAEMYWVNKRNTVLTQYWEAVRQGDREAVADVREKIAEFNEDAPPPMRLDGGDLSRSVKARQKRARADELGIPVQKQSRAAYAEMADTFRGSKD